VSRPRSRRSGLSLVEVVVATAILATLMAFSMGALLAMQRQAADTTVRQEVVGRARKVVQDLVTELRDLNLNAADLVPSAPFEVADLQYRLAVDQTAGALVLDPTRASGTFRRVRLVGTRLELRLPDGSVRPLADQVAGLKLTLLPPDRLRLVVTVSRKGTDGVPVFGIADVTVLLRNQG
jgi:prepilin-type N-terminal cleavage/methylation domain-containing protein